ncbi:pyridoxal-5'-phosphate-dependent protein [Curtobacterium oceanosedimentum]|uniref:Pyridoxal-5'-phosphate-dependent protein n=1 Tax=Curtobacterium oceanosedimentum TaxID=465820 RepID=A0A147DUX3_9MICO|nr:pyridoxal-5'-phosphate-dependent protein [Curtobacterium oceanosedimentum]KTR54350.1 pyridoxal-5'-phosphate-dependent protein [Curtobacterium oceanosedimentum]
MESVTHSILLSPPDVGPDEAAAVARALESGWVAPAGPDLTAFEREAAARVGSPHAVAVSSGTAALHLSLLAAGVGPGDVVPTSTMTFAATANAIRYTGARPVFVDSTDIDGNIDVVLLRSVLRRLRDGGQRIGAVVPVDLLGHVVDYTAISALCDEFEAPFIADAAESFGSLHRGRPVGSFGFSSCVSFNGNKIMTTSGGGMVFTDSPDVAERLRYLATQARQPVAHYEHTEVGYNYRLSNVLAALGRAQLRRLDSMIERRRAVRTAYRDVLDRIPGVRVLGRVSQDQHENCWLTAVVVDPDRAGWAASDLARALAAADVESRPLWKPMHLQPAHAGADAAVTGVAESLFLRGLALPSGSSLCDDDLDRVLSVIRSVAG